MKKWLLLFIIVIALGGGGFIFRSELAKSLADEANEQIEAGIDILLERAGVPEGAADRIREITQKMDTHILLEFLADPEAFVSGKTEDAKEFMATPAGAELSQLYAEHLAP